MKERINFISELWDAASFFFVAPESYDEKTVKKRWKEDTPDRLTELASLLENLSDFSAENQEKEVKGWIEANGYHLGNIMNAFRMTVLGEPKGPQMYDITALLGKEESVRRIRKAVEVIRK